MSSPMQAKFNINKGATQANQSSSNSARRGGALAENLELTDTFEVTSASASQVSAAALMNMDKKQIRIIALKLGYSLIRLRLLPKLIYLNERGNRVERLLAPRLRFGQYDQREGYRVLYYELSPSPNGVEDVTLNQLRRAEQTLTKWLSTSLGYWVEVQASESRDIHGFPCLVLAVALDGTRESFVALPERLALNGGAKAPNNNKALPNQSSSSKEATYISSSNPAESVPTGAKAIEIGLPRLASFFDYVDVTNPFPTDEMEFCLGVGADGELLKLELEKLDHFIAAGSPNTGKSSFITAQLAQILYSELQQPGRFKIALVDIRGITFNHEMFEGLPQLYRKHVLTNTEEILHLFTELAAEQDRRADLYRKAKVQKLSQFNRKMRLYKQDRFQLPAIVVFIEESNELAESLKGRFTEPMKAIIKVCRKYGIYFRNAGPSFKASTYDSDIVDSSTAHIVFGDFDSDTARVLNMGNQRQSEVVPGRGMYRQHGRSQEFQSLYIEDDNFQSLINHLRERAGLSTLDLTPDLEGIARSFAAMNNRGTNGERVSSTTPFADHTPKATQPGGGNLDVRTSREQAGNTVQKLGTISSEFPKGTGTREQSGNTAQSLFPASSGFPNETGTVGTEIGVPGSGEQVPGLGTSSAPVPPQNQNSSRSEDVPEAPEIYLDAAQIAQIVEMIGNGNGNKSDIIKAVAKLSGVSYGRNYRNLAMYYERLVAAVKGGSNTNYSAAEVIPTPTAVPDLKEMNSRPPAPSAFVQPIETTVSGQTQKNNQQRQDGARTIPNTLTTDVIGQTLAQNLHQRGNTNMTVSVAPNSSSSNSNTPRDPVKRYSAYEETERVYAAIWHYPGLSLALLERVIAHYFGVRFGVGGLEAKLTLLYEKGLIQASENGEGFEAIGEEPTIPLPPNITQTKASSPSPRLGNLNQPPPKVEQPFRNQYAS